MECGRGMYVRSLAHDLGADLGCGAHLKELTRLHTGPFDISTAISMAEVEEACRNGRLAISAVPGGLPPSEP